MLLHCRTRHKGMRICVYKFNLTTEHEICITRDVFFLYLIHRWSFFLRWAPVVTILGKFNNQVFSNLFGNSCIMVSFKLEKYFLAVLPLFFSFPLFATPIHSCVNAFPLATCSHMLSCFIPFWFWYNSSSLAGCRLVCVVCHLLLTTVSRCLNLKQVGVGCMTYTVCVWHTLCVQRRERESSISFIKTKEVVFGLIAFNPFRLLSIKVFCFIRISFSIFAKGFAD